MGIAEDIAQIKSQEQTLVLRRLDEDVAFAIGSQLRNAAHAAGLMLVVDIRTWDRQLFFAAIPGTNFDNAEWVRRKINVVRRFQKSSYRMLLEHNNEPLLAPHTGTDPADYVLAGGGFPLRVTGAGIVGCLTISGLPGRDDHAVAVDALCAHLGIDATPLQLPPG